PLVFDGAWVPTLPARANGIMPFVANARVYLAEDITAVAPAFPYAYSFASQSEFYKMVKEVYDVSLTLTPEQKNIALFWIDQGNGVGYTPAGHDMLIVTQAMEQRGTNLALAAEAYAKACIAERDATIVCFRSKYISSIMRPITFIQDHIDATWFPFIVTPPHPEYPAAHSFVTGSVMQAVTKVLGDKVKITDHSYDFRGWSPRPFNSLLQAAEEAGISRFYGGIHYLNSIKTGLNVGRVVGLRIGEIKLHD
ncbi:MAG: vanadium-dependent haloperoxidase, partial [Ferruginibacter sp.]